MKICKVKDCNNKVKTRGYCIKHYGQWLRNGTTLPKEKERNIKHPEKCTVLGCNNPYAANGYCSKHYQQIRTYGRLVPEREKNTKLNLVGERFGRLLVLSKSSKKVKGGEILWECLCNCGNIKDIRTSSLLHGLTQSCGCLRNERAKENIKKAHIILPEGQAAENALFAQYKKSAKERNLEWSLDRKTFNHLIKQICFYCGSKPQQIYKISSNGFCIYNGLDRVDSTKGYAKENCVSCCIICNKAKNKFSKQEFLNWINLIYNHQRLKFIHSK